MSIVYVVIGDFDATKRGKVGAGAEGTTDIFGKSADVGTA